CEYLTNITRAMSAQEDGVLGFYGVYGYLRDEFIDSIGLNPGKDFIPQQRPWYQLAIRKQKAEYTAPYVDKKTGRTVISLTQQVYGKNNDYYGVLSLDVDLAWMIGYAKSLALAEGGYGMIVNQYLYVIAHPDEAHTNSPLQEMGKGYAELAEILRRDHAVTAKHITDHTGTGVIVFFRELYNGWYIGVAMPTSSYYSDLYLTALFLLGLGVTLSAALTFLLLRQSAAKMQSDEENRSKSSFLAMMSHEIRTPLNAIIGLSEIQMQKELPSDTRIDIETIYTSGSNLLGIINDILDFSKLDAGGFSLVPENYDLASLINDTVQLNLVRIGSLPIEFLLQIPPEAPSRLHGDELRVKQVLNNLLSNAFKYTKQGQVKLSLRCEQQDDEALLTFAVADSGIGIKKTDMGKLFSEYSRVDLWKNRELQGTGLGLAITKRLTEQMRGSISVESVYGKGSTFTVTLRQDIVDATPIGEAVVESLTSFRFTDRRPHHTRARARVLMPEARVLAVDDIATNLTVIRGLLAPYEVTVDCAQSGYEAVERIRDASVRYDAVFMDHMMPGMDGIEATRIIRSEIGTEYARNLPIIALTANALAGNDEMFLSKGFSAFISKPVNPDTLERVLREWVEARQPESALRRTSVEEGAEFSSLDRFAIEGITLSSVRNNYASNPDAYLAVLRSYIAHTPALLESLRFPDKNTLAAYAVTVHGIKGSSWSIGANALGEEAKTLELAAKQGDYETVAAGTDAFIANAETLLRAVQACLDTQNENLAKDIREAIDPAQLQAMLEACQNFDVMRMEELTTQLEQTGYESPHDTGLVFWLRKQLNDLEYDAIQERLRKELGERSGA
ncbi:response regulator, partial [Desulfovibrio sp. OttesenSCG-928-G15]|nr:response regulator [Desulfovibrio sp. OttesenSCG-928-G15]